MEQLNVNKIESYKSSKVKLENKNDLLKWEIA
jgi:hypothetical protein